jgi:glycosyltransferase involved in cell wall biosynthesis
MPDRLPHHATAVLIPCLNEETTVGEVVAAFRAALPGATVYVFDNNSVDRTASVAAEAGAVVRHVSLPGKGNVVRRMFADIDADAYLLVDGDGTYDPAVAGEMVDYVLLGGEDFVTATRMPLDAAAYRRGHVTGNRAISLLVRFLFKRDVPDMLSGYKAMSRRFVKSLPALSQQFEIETEIAVHALELGAGIVSVPTPYRERPQGSASKLSTYRDGTRIVRTVVRLARQGRPLFFFGLVAVILAAAAIVLGIPIVDTYVHTHKVPRFPTAILATGLVLLSALSVTAGLLLDTVAVARREAKLLRYLAIAPPGRRRRDAAGEEALELRSEETGAAPS